MQAAKACAKLWEMLGKPVYSPVAHGASVEPYMRKGDAENHSRWMLHCFEILGHCNEMYVLCCEGWKSSKGIALEIEFCADEGIPVSFVEMTNDGTLFILDGRPQ
jgi:Domain of unknown function (DUF1937)